MFYMKQNKKSKLTLESVQYGLEIIFKNILVPRDRELWPGPRFTDFLSNLANLIR